MASLRAPGLGPIVGHTTQSTCRIWIRAGDPGDSGPVLDEDRRTVGVIGIVTPARKIGRAWYFRLHREYDRTGAFVLGRDVQLGFYPDDYAARGKPVPARPPREAVAEPLKPDTVYTVRVGTLTIDDPMPNAAMLADWQLIERLPEIDKVKDELLGFRAEECEATFRTFPAPQPVAGKMSFLLGSCRYPGLLWKIKEADRIFAPMAEHLEPEAGAGDPVRFTMMCGDQIYADMLNRGVPLLRADTYAEFQERYVTAFGAPNLRKLLRTSTTYMILDDHEIEDNWVQDRIEDPGEHHVFNIAIGAYMSYQWSHGPRTWGQLLYYTFECAGYPFFVLDTRTQRLKNSAERSRDQGLRDNHMLGYPNIDPVHPGQLRRLLDWLSDQQKARGDAPKFIVTSSVFVPNSMDERLYDADAPADLDKLWFEVNRDNRDRSDSWPAFPLTRRAILERILADKVQNVVFLAGDIHCSNVAEMEFERRNGAGVALLPLKAFSVTSSAFYWPFPFADGDPNGYVHDSRQEGQQDPFPVSDDTVMHYRSFGYTQKDNFTRLDIDQAAGTLTVRVFDREGKPVRLGDREGKLVEANVLRLAGW
jgi:alkaline phosphatase D